MKTDERESLGESPVEHQLTGKVVYEMCWKPCEMCRSLREDGNDDREALCVVFVIIRIGCYR